MYARGIEESYGGSHLYPAGSNQFGGGFKGYQFKDYAADTGFGGGYETPAPMRGYVSARGSGLDRGGQAGLGGQRGRGAFQSPGADRGRGRGFGGDRGRGVDRGRGRGADRGRGGGGQGGNRAGGMGIGGFDMGAGMGEINSWEDLGRLQGTGGSWKSATRGSGQSGSGGGNRGRGQIGNRGGTRGSAQSASYGGNRGGGQFGNQGGWQSGTRGGGQSGNRGVAQFGNRGGAQFGNRGGAQFGNRGGAQSANRGFALKRPQSRGPGYTAEHALADSPWYCAICNMKVTGPSNLTDHLLGSKHKTALDAYILQSAGSPLPAKYLFCSLCKVGTTNHDNLMSHLNGQKHQTNLHNYGKQDGSGGALPKTNVKAKESVLGSIALVTEPLIGLEHVTEYLHLDPPQDPHYECKVCDLVLIGGNLTPHLLGHKHRLKYIQKFRTHFYDQCIRPIWDNFEQEAGQGEERRDEEKNRNNSMQVKLKEVAARLEAMDGRKTIKSMTVRGGTRPTQVKAGVGAFNKPFVHKGQSAPTVNGSNAAKAPTASQLSDDIIHKEYEKRFGKDLKRDADQASLASGGPPDKKPFIPEKDRMQYLLTELSSAKIVSEEDAAMALQVSNNLTQALLNYRLNSIGQ